MDRCPKHPDIDTMVPCLGCGRYFCRICTPPRGAGQLCENCYEESVLALASKADEKTSGEKSGGLKLKRDAGEKKPRKKRDFKAQFVSFGAKIKRAPVALARGFKSHFPVGLADKEDTGGTMPPLLGSWYKLLIIVVATTFIWVMAVALLKRRMPLISIIIAAIVAIGVIIAFGGRMDLETAAIAAAFALLVLGTGEVIVYVLYRAEMIEKLDIMGAQMIDIENPLRYYSAYFYNMLVMRIIPACIVAFTIALWPFSKRFTWAGFKTK